jgi:hypothetical protein
MMTSRKSLFCLFILACTMLLSVFTVSATATGNRYYVSLLGSDSYDGRSLNTAFATLQHALDIAQPGDTIELTPGNYYQDVVTVRDGQPDAPITITGSANTVIRGYRNNRIFQVFHDHIILNGFTIDGYNPNGEGIGGYTDKLLYVLGNAPYNGVNGLRVINMAFRNAGGECVRLRYYAQHNEIAYSTFVNCGRYDFEFGQDGVVGEGLYIGTSSNQWGDGKNPTADADVTAYNWVHHNYFQTNGNECVELKEGAIDNLIEHNVCTGQYDENSGGMVSRGNSNTFRNNEIYGNVGAGIRVGGHLVNGIQYGIGNHIYSNTIHHNDYGGIKLMISGQGIVCGNVLYDNAGGDIVGTYADEINPTEPCDDSEPTLEPSATPTSVPATATPVLPTITYTSTATSVPPTATLVLPTATNTPTATLVPPTATHQPTATYTPVVQPTTAAVQVYTITLVWNGEDSLFVINQSNTDFPLGQLHIRGRGEINGSEWGVATLVTGQCVAAWRNGGNPQAAESACSLVGNVLTRTGAERFWKSSFDVTYNGAFVANCATSPCTVLINR